MKAFGERFTERKVAPWAIGYLGVAWVGVQVLQLAWGVFEWPLAPLRVIVTLIAAGFPVVVALAWYRGGRQRPVDAGSSLPAVSAKKHMLGIIASSAVIILLLGVVGATVNRSLDRQWARAEAVLEMRRLADARDYGRALEVGRRALAILPHHPALDSLIDMVSDIPAIQTEPAGADILMKEYADTAGDWVPLGRTPLGEVRVPRGVKRWRITRAGSDTLVVASSPTVQLNLRLPVAGSIPRGMVRVQGGRGGGLVTGIGPLTPAAYGDFFIDKYEVTNAEYQEFVRADGYTRAELWKHEFSDGAQRLSYAEAMKRFKDATGRPGPATWELGRPKPGEEALPVTGVSWYEAAAYAEFRGKSLPTLRHWMEAAGTLAGGAIIPLSNLEGKAPAAAGTYKGMSPTGAFDMAGNVREWVVNSAGSQRYALGGAWSDPTYFFSGPNVQPPFDRLPTTGFRLAQYNADDFAGQAGSNMPLATRNYELEKPVSDEIFRVYAAQFAYDRTPLNARVDTTLQHEFGTVQRVSYDGVGWGRIHAYLYLPANVKPPFQTVVWFAGSSAAVRRPDPDPRTISQLRHYVASGRAVLWPIVRNVYSRADAQQLDGMRTTWPKDTREYVDLMRSWVSEVRRSIDYLETRNEIDAHHIAYLGTSWGGRMGAIIPAAEPRFKVNLILLGGLASGRALPEVDQINYVTRVTAPTLMLNCRDDPWEPVQSAQLPMLKLLGTSSQDKRHVMFEGCGHALPETDMIRETLDWLDKYFGPVRH
jgi:dienelactone hydrolase